LIEVVRVGVEVDLRGGDVRVAHECLDLAQRGAVLQRLGGERVAEDVNPALEAELVL